MGPIIQNKGRLGSVFFCLPLVFQFQIICQYSICNPLTPEGERPLVEKGVRCKRRAISLKGKKSMFGEIFFNVFGL